MKKLSERARSARYWQTNFIAKLVLSDQQIGELLTKIPPTQRYLFAEHVTLAYGVGPDYPLPSTPQTIKVVGVVEGNGVQAAVVEWNGRTYRDDGVFFHITISTDGTPPGEARLLDRSRMKRVEPFVIITNSKLDFRKRSIPKDRFLAQQTAERSA